MQLNPRYGGEPIVRVETAPPGRLMVGQRERLGLALGSLTGDQWSAPSRCEGWTVRDVISHLVTTNEFWAISITLGQQGSPTRFLESFDPVATPAALVEGTRSMTSAEVLDRYMETSAQLAAAVAGIEGEAWEVPAESPPGHVATSAVVLHALWDSWIHERDVLIPLGSTPVVDDEEVVACLRYVAALGPVFLASMGSTRTGTLVIEATTPDARAVVDVGPTVVVRDGGTPGGAPVLRGQAVALVEALSFRAPLDHDLGADAEWMLGGLDVVFDRA